MIIRASERFVERLRCAVSLSGRDVVQYPRLDGWNGDIFHSRSGQCAMLMNDASLAMVVIPLKGITTFDQLLGIFFQRAARLFADAGGVLETGNQTVIVLRRSDRSMIGTMNAAKEHARFAIEVALEEIEWDKLEDRLNGRPFATLDYACPKDELPRAISSPLG